MNMPEQQNPKHIDTFYVLDFDRCLGNVTELYELLVCVLEQMGVTTARELAEVRVKVEDTGGSFDAIRYLFTAGLLNEASFIHLRQQYRQAADIAKLREPGATELIEVLDARQQTYGILTYGGDLWQQTKLSAAQFDHIPYLVTQTKQKGVLLRSWQNAEGLYEIPSDLTAEPLVATKLVLVDDKADSFHGFPPSPSYGYHVFDPNNHVAAQAGDVPVNVTRIANLQILAQQFANS